MTIIRAKRLTTFTIAPDGGSISSGVAEEDGKAGALMPPAECLKELMMTLTEMMRRALRLQHDDPSLFLVYSAAGWEVERAKVPGTFIVTLPTPDGFEVSFALTAADLTEMADAVRTPGLDAAPQPTQRRVHQEAYLKPLPPHPC